MQTDATAPTVPGGATATPVSSSQINLSWTASTDNVGVTQYKVYRNTDSYTTPIATVTAPTASYSNTGLTASTAYSYKVAACDAASNCSAQSTSASATTPAAPDTTPDAFGFTAATGQALTATASSNTVTPVGYNAAAAISISGGGGAYSINGGAFTSAAGSISPGQTVQVRVNTSGVCNTITSTTLTVGTTTATFSATTLACDTAPGAFGFTAAPGLGLSTVVTSNTVTPTGYNAAAPISVSGGSYSINGGAFVTAPGTISPGQSVAVRLTSSGSFSTTLTATLTIGNVPGTFSVTTQAAPVDTTPDAFGFTAATGQVLNTAASSNTVTPVGYNAAAAISISGGGGAYSINGGAFTSAAGSISPGQTVQVRVNTSGVCNTTTSTTLTVGTTTATFTATTLACVSDTTPNVFVFTSQTGVALNTTVTSNTITVSGINAAASISITGGSYNVNGGSFTTASGTVNDGNTVTVRLTSSASNGTQSCATVNIGGVSGQFCATTQLAPGDTMPDAFGFTAATGQALNTTASSNTVTPVGYTAAAPISISGGGGAYSINGGAFTSAAGSISPGQTVQVRVNTSGVCNTTTSTTLTVGTTTATFSATTLACGSDTTPNAFSFTSQTRVPFNSTITSNPISVSGINTPAAISITGGNYSVSGGAYTTGAGTVNNGNSVTVRLTSSGSSNTQTCATLTIGGVAGQFCATTATVAPFDPKRILPLLLDDD